jgi:Gluconate 2-dehydrogenase subunit 3
MAEKDEEKISGCAEKPGVSRRKWLIDIGKAAALAGIVGKAVPFEAGAPAEKASAEVGAGNLPPGLFQPSPEHMGNALVNDARFRAIPPGCPVDFVRAPSGPFEPQFFSHEEYKVIRRLSALMLGESSAASGDGSANGNIVDEVAEWIDLRAHSHAGVREAAERLTPEQVALAKAYDGGRHLERLKNFDPQEIYRAGLKWIAAESARRHQREFLELSEEQQAAILDTIGDERYEKGAENDGPHFFPLLKGDIISGFYTSQIGLKELDDKNHGFYPESPGCPAGGLNTQKT